MCTTGVVTELVSYPIKSCAGTSLSDTVMTPAGLPHDRTFMVIDPGGVFRIQRQQPRMATIRPSVSDDGTTMTLRAPDVEPWTLRVRLDAPRRDVTLFGQLFRGIDQGDEVAGWLTDVLGVPSRLVRVPPEHDRVTDGETPGTSGYADSCPVHLLSTATLDDLNKRLADQGSPAMPMTRFRPNIVVDGWADPHVEDSARRISAGAAELAYAKPAIRCVITTVDQERGVKTGKEPLRTLATYRRVEGGLAFGAKFAVTGPGRIRLGDKVDIVR